MSLVDNLTQWAVLRKRLDDVEAEITEEVLALGKTQSYGDVVAKYRKSSTNGKYDYVGICHELEPDEEVVEQYTVRPEPYIDYKKLADAVGVPDDVKQRHYTPPAEPKPVVTIQFIK